MATKKKEEVRPEGVEQTSEALGTVETIMEEAQDEISSEQATLNKAADAAAPEQKKAPELETLSALADRHRVVSWQQAALMRLMDWEDDKRVSEAEYLAALENLKHRRIGGGRG